MLLILLISARNARMVTGDYHQTMPIVGHGIDIVEVARIERMLQDHPDQFLERCFTSLEQAIASETPRRTEHIAGRFAAKEAVLKALGTGWRHGIAWTEIEILRDDAGKPILRLSGQAARFADALGARRWSLSVSHIHTHAIASAIAEDLPCLTPFLASIPSMLR